jgi:hypothetical protein
LVKIISVFLIAVLVVLATLHAYWGAGGRWPGHDERSLVERVIGRTRNMRMPGLAACMLVAAALLGAAALAALQGNVIAIDLGVQGARLTRIALWIVFVVFALRGLAGLIPSVFAYAHGTPFVLLNRVFYSPLCLLVAAGIAAVGIKAG